MEHFYIYSEEKKTSRLAYTVNILNEHPYCKGSKVVFSLTAVNDGQRINYTNKVSDTAFNMKPSRLVFEDFEGELYMNPYNLGDAKYYSVEEREGGSKDFFRNGQFAFDVFEAIFFHLSRYEELAIDFKSYLGRKYDFESRLLVVRNKLEKLPIVDDLIHAFLEVLLDRKLHFPKEQYLSHDIDYITKFNSPLSIFRKIAGHFRHRKSILGISYVFRSYWDYLFKGQDGFDTFDWMLSKRDLDKTIYFLIGGKHKEDNSYDLKGKVFQKAIKLARERNYHIGIHPSYESWEKPELIAEEKAKLEDVLDEEIVRSRQHYLNFDIKKTPGYLHAVGIKEDSSLGYTRHVGYRCGTAFPYRLYDFVEEKAFDLVEKPLIFMDVAWLFEGIREGNLELPDLGQYGGSLNFHNSTFDEMGARRIEMREHYLKFFR